MSDPLLDPGEAGGPVIGTTKQLKNAAKASAKAFAKQQAALNKAASQAAKKAVANDSALGLASQLLAGGPPASVAGGNTGGSSFPWKTLIILALPGGLLLAWYLHHKRKA